MFNLSKQLFISGLCILLIGCGYQLRGQAPALAENQSVWLNTEASEVAVLLKKTLLQNKVTVLTSTIEKNTAGNIINLGEPVISQSASAYDSEGDIVEYNLSYQLSFNINDREHQFTSTVSYRYDSVQLLSSEQNKRIATEDILNQAVAFIIRQL